MSKEITRETAIDSVNKLLVVLPEIMLKGREEGHSAKVIKEHREDAIRMIDREIGGLLGHPASPFMNTYRNCVQTLFPGGLERTDPGKDIIMSLNNETSKTSRGVLKIPEELRNPEKGVAQVIGIDLAKEMFSMRMEILNRLCESNPAWQVNLEAHIRAEAVLENYDPTEKTKRVVKSPPSVMRSSGQSSVSATSQASSAGDDSSIWLPPCIKKLVEYFSEAAPAQVERSHLNSVTERRERVLVRGI